MTEEISDKYLKWLNDAKDRCRGKLDIPELQRKAERWDNYFEPKYDMRPTYQVLEKQLSELKSGLEKILRNGDFGKNERKKLEELLEKEK